MYTEDVEGRVEPLIADEEPPTSIINIVIIVLFVCLIFLRYANSFINALLFKTVARNFEHFSTNAKNRTRITFLRDQNIYDDFYVNVYDMLVYNKTKNDYELKALEHDTNMVPENSRILDLGCGTGHHVAELLEKGYKHVSGIDLSPSMIQRCKSNYPDDSRRFRQADALDKTLYHDNSFTHILCLYFTIYEFKNKEEVFRNVHRWLLPGGFFVVHLVDRAKFNPIVPMSMPYILVNPQTYAHERMTKSKVYFDQYAYEANFDLDEDSDSAIITEKYINRHTQKIFRKTEMNYFMESIDFVVTLAKKEGFKVAGIIDLIKVSYEYQYLYIFRKKE